jgi:hypothetical protein
MSSLALVVLVGPVPERISAPRARAAVSFSSRQTGPVRLEFTTLVPRAKADIVATSHQEPGSPWRVHRILMDAARGLYYGYDIEVARSEGAETFQVDVKALSAQAARTFEQGEWQDFCRGCVAPRPVANAAQRFPGPQTVLAGQLLTIDLLADETTGELITEQIGLSVPRPGRRDSVRAPQDLKPENMLFQMAEPSLRVNGKPTAEDGTGSVQADVVWTALPGRGRVFFSLVPRPGYDFTKTAVVAGDRISFTIDGDAYEWISTGPIVTPGPVAPFNNVQSWYVWMLRDPGYDLAGKIDAVVGGGLDERAMNRLRRP